MKSIALFANYKPMVLLMLCSLMTNYSIAQNLNTRNHIVVVDAITNTAIPHATITNSANQAWVADQYGKIPINRYELLQKLPIKVSCVGYTAISISESALTDTLKLWPDNKMLQAVSVSAGVYNEPDINGKYKNAFLMGLQREEAQFIPNSTQTIGVVQNVSFALSDKHKGIDAPFRIHIYAKVAGNAYPQQDLLPDTLIVRNIKKRKLFIVDVSAYQIKFPKEGLFVSMETLSSKHYSSKLYKYWGMLVSRVPGIRGNFKNNQFGSRDDDSTVDQTKRYALSHATDGNNRIWYFRIEGVDYAIDLKAEPDVFGGK